MTRRHFVIPDVQAKPNLDFEHLTWAGRAICHYRPDVIIQIGDFADMESLSSYDKGKKSFEGRSYVADIDAASEAMRALFKPIVELQTQQRKNKGKLYTPRFVLTLGNHENRINKAIEEDRKLEGLISLEDLPYEDWEVYPFLEPVVIDDICYSHYFSSGQLGRPCVSARSMLVKKHMSCVAGHQQGRDIAYDRRADGVEMTAIISGSYYQHDEGYLNPQTNNHWRGCWVLNDVRNGQFDELPLSLRYLQKKYG